MSSSHSLCLFCLLSTLYPLNSCSFFSYPPHLAQSRCQMALTTLAGSAGCFTACCPAFTHPSPSTWHPPSSMTTHHRCVGAREKAGTEHCCCIHCCQSGDTFLSNGSTEGDPCEISALILHHSFWLPHSIHVLTFYRTSS